MRRKDGYPIADYSTVALCMIGVAVLMVPIFGLVPLIAVAIGLALGYEALNRPTRVMA